jgi:hypothetical protein
MAEAPFFLRLVAGAHDSRSPCEDDRKKGKSNNGIWLRGFFLRVFLSRVQLSAGGGTQMA